MSRIFISYRRNDTAGYAGRLYDRLSQHFGEDQVFMDVSAIELGENFVQVLEQQVASCDVLIVLIGNQWLGSTDDKGNRRLEDSKDWVRLEIGTALERNVRVIPVLVRGTTMPQPEDLPELLRGLAERQALDISDARFHEDIDRIIQSLDKSHRGGSAHRPKVTRLSTRHVVAFLATLVVISALFYFYRMMSSDPEIYQVRVTVLDPQQTPVDDANVWSSLGGEPKKVAGGWEFDIPAASRPADGKLTIYAAQETGFLTGRQDLQLGADANLSIMIPLEKHDSASVTGNVFDGSGQAIAGAEVSVVGSARDPATTKPNGNFVLPAQWAHGEMVELYVQKAGYKPTTQWHPAGDTSATIILKRK